MAEAFNKLEQILRSSPYKMTPVEAEILQTVKGKARRDFTLAALVTSGVVWTATRRLRYVYRIELSGGAGFFSGFWRCYSSINSSLDKILALEGSRMQTELAKILLTKHQDDHWTNHWAKKIFKKHFYPEQVFDDSSVDRPISRWRLRNHYGDSAAQSQSERTVDSDTSTDLEPKQFTDPRHSPLQMSSSVEVSANPFDCLFGYSEKHEEIHHPDISPKRRIRNRKRNHRRRRNHHTEVSTEKLQAELE